MTPLFFILRIVICGVILDVFEDRSIIVKATCHRKRRPTAGDGKWTNPAINYGLLNIDGFVKSQFLFGQRPFGGVSSRDAKFQELVASSSNSLKFLTHHRLKRSIPK